MAKNPCGKTVKPENAYAVYQDDQGEWTYYVLKHYQLEEKAKNNPYARYSCFVTSPMCPNGEYGDVYRVTVLNGTHLIENPLAPVELCPVKQTTAPNEKMSKYKPQRGDSVTCRTREEAYYSRYAGNPECWFEPGDEGVVAAVDVPVVVNTSGHLTFCCIDFYKEGIPHNQGRSPWRVGLYYDNIVVLRRKQTLQQK